MAVVDCRDVGLTAMLPQRDGSVYLAGDALDGRTSCEARPQGTASLFQTCQFAVKQRLDARAPSSVVTRPSHNRRQAEEAKAIENGAMKRGKYKAKNAE
jgi:hypothetical protein